MLTLIHLTPYRSSDQPTCMPFPSAQCEYHFWIRSAGNVSVLFLLWRGDWGYSVHCEGVQWDKSAGSSHTFSRIGRVEYYTGIFVIESSRKNVKDCCVRLQSAKVVLLHSFGQKVCKKRVKEHSLPAKLSPSSPTPLRLPSASLGLGRFIN